jgi:hypothetical protein
VNSAKTSGGATARDSTEWQPEKSKFPKNKNNTALKIVFRMFVFSKQLLVMASLE